MRHALIATALMSGLAAPGWAEEPRTGGTARVSMGSDILGTQPGVARDSGTDTVLHHIMESLVAYDDNLAVQPVLAESWEISDDGTTYTFDLRDGVSFHNGEPMTSAEVKWSWERWLDPEIGWGCNYWYDGSEALKIESIETPDPDTVVFKLNMASGLFLGQMSNFQCLPAIVHPDSVNADGEWADPIGTGPYMLAEWNKGVSIALDRFEGYTPPQGETSGYAGPREAYLDRIEFIVVPETATALASLRTGELQLTPSIGPNDEAELQSAETVTVLNEPGLEWNTLLINLRDPVMSDINMRRAIAHAIDFEGVARAVTRGAVGYNPASYSTQSTFHTDVQKQGYTRDLDKVAELLETAGYNGEPIRIQTSRRYGTMYQQAVIIQSMLSEAGIKAELDVMEWPAHLEHYLQGTFQLSSFGYSARTDPVLNYWAVIGPWEESPSYQWDNPEIYDMTFTAAASSDPEERQAVFDTIHKTMIEEVPTLNLYDTAETVAVHDSLKGFSLWAGGKARLWGTWLAE